MNGQVLFTEEIYSLKNDRQVDDYFMINNSKYVSKVDKYYRELHIQDKELFNEIILD